jgi:hypothetical protein
MVCLICRLVSIECRVWNDRASDGLWVLSAEQEFPILLEGNQSDAINFDMQKKKELKGFFVPATYCKYAKEELKNGVELETSTSDDLNRSFDIQFRRKSSHADR